MSSTPFPLLNLVSGWQVIDLKELKEYRDLFYFLVWRNIKVLYAQTILGFFGLYYTAHTDCNFYDLFLVKSPKYLQTVSPIFVFERCNYPLDIHVPVHDGIESKPCDRTAYAGQGVFPQVDLSANFRFIRSG